ncbi:hypothetical protein QFC19_003406 [Naganishia cerealis]|uniref:Uncharacterized protein n=1 Tax=Naganishia cerealis TaxID=610337 RepID=A0ACC2W4T5_9TREE|nr:hypothetical protein QFC19_003406 [Naganishia cerealis]
MERRRLELEEKRRKLEEMKRAREERMAATAALRRPVAPTPSTDRFTRDIPQASTRGNRQQVDDLLNNIQGQPVTAQAPTSSLSRPGSALSGSYQNKIPSATYRNQATQNIPEASTRDDLRVPSDEAGEVQRDTTIQSPVSNGLRVDTAAESNPGDRTLDYIDAQEELFEIPQRAERITYSRGVQTFDLSTESDQESTERDQEINQAGRETEEELRKRLESEFDIEKEKLERQIQELVDEEKKRSRKGQVTELSQEEKLEILAAPEFARFLEDSGKIIQRALSDGYDYIRDYAIGGEELLKTREVSVTCLDFPDNETGTFWVGTEEGGIYVADRFDRAGQKSGINSREIYKAHDAPVTSVDFHPLKGSIDFSDLFLSTSVDWTVKLWRARPGSKPSNGMPRVNGTSGQTTNVPPIYSFEESSDYVFDAKWHPNHPAVFGTVSGDGQFEIWNLNADTEVCFD